MSDPVIDFMVIAFPFVMSVIGMLVGSPQKHKVGWGVSLIFVGAIMSLLTYWHQERLRTREAEAGSAFEKRVIKVMSERVQEIQVLMDKVQALAVQSTAPKDWAPHEVRLPLRPTAEEIAFAVGREMRDIQAASDAPTPALSPAASQPAVPEPTVSPPPVLPSTVPPPPASPSTDAAAPPPMPEVINSEVPQIAAKEPCHPDKLQDCTADELIAWGRPIVFNLQSIKDSYIDRIRSLDDVPTLGWVTELFNSRESREDKLRQIQDDTVARFKQCCAQTAKYYQELSRRVGTGDNPKTLAFSWLRRLETPISSSSERNPNSEAKNILILLVDLYSMQMRIKLATRVSSITSSKPSAPRSPKPVPFELKVPVEILRPDDQPR